MTDTAVLKSASDAVQCFVVATLASVTPAVPFIFRNYEYSPDYQPPRASAPPNDEASLYELGGSSKHLVWQAVRASSAAPYYLDDFVCGQDRYLLNLARCSDELGHYYYSYYCFFQYYYCCSCSHYLYIIITSVGTREVLGQSCLML